MNKAEMVARIARDAGLTKSDALKAVDALVDNVTKALKKGEKVALVDSAALRYRNARHGPDAIPRPASRSRYPPGARRVSRRARS